MELGNISSDNIFITSNRHDDNIYYYNDNYIQQYQMNNYIFAICQSNKNKLHKLIASSYEEAVEKAKEEIDKYLNLDDDTYAILDNNDSWINIRAELAKKGIGVTYIRDIEELFNL